MIKTPAQRVGLAFVGLVFGVFLAFGLLRNRAVVDAPLGGAGDRTAELLQGVDPNTADEASLASIPGLNRSTARSIVEYREEHVGRNPGGNAFKGIEDLEPVKGIGPATLKKMEPYLIFP